MPFKLFIENKPKESELKYSLTSLTCSSGFIKQYTRIVDEFNKLYSRRAYLHYYLNAGID